MLIFQADPTTLDYVWIFTQLLVDKSSTGTYVVVVALYDCRMCPYLEVYNSIMNAWTINTTMPL